MPGPCPGTRGSRRDCEPPSRRLVRGSLTSGWKWGNLSSISDSYPDNYHLSESTNLAINCLIWQISEPKAHAVKSSPRKITASSPPSLQAMQVTPVRVSVQVHLRPKAQWTGCDPPLCPWSALRESSTPPRPEGFAGRMAFLVPIPGSRARGNQTSVGEGNKGSI